MSLHMDISPISATLQAAVQLIHEQTHSKKADAYLLCEVTLNQAREIHDDAAFIAVATNYALVIDQQGYPDRCIDILYEALQLAQSYHLFHEEGRLLIVIGRAVYTRAEYQRAMQAWAHALEVAELCDDLVTWVWAKVGIAQIYDALEDHPTAVILLQQAQEKAQHLNEPILQLNVYLNLGVNLFKTQQLEAAQSTYRSAISIAEQLGFRDDIGETLFRMAEVYVAQADYEHALHLLNEADIICNSTHHIWALANIHGVRAAIHIAQNNLNAAHIELQQGIEDAKRSGSTHILMRLLFSQSELAEKMNDATLSLKSFKAAIEIKNQIYAYSAHQQINELEDIAGLRPSPGLLLIELANNPELDNSNTTKLATLICKNSLEILKIPQASYWEYRREPQEFVNIIRCSTVNSTSSKETIRIDEHHLFVDGILRGESFIAHTVQHHQRTWKVYQTYFKPSQISAIIAIPVKINNTIKGFLCFEHCHSQHNWSGNEIQYANQLTTIMARGISNIELGFFVNEIAELNAKLLKNNDDLEERVNKRTKELSSALEHLIQSEKLASLGSLVAGFAHELNTPLGNALTAASTLLEKNKELIDTVRDGALKKSKLDQYLDESSMIAQLVERNARKASDLIHNLKQVAVDTTSSKQRHFDLLTIINETLFTISPSLRNSKVSINNLVPASIQLLSYPGSLEQIITNLMNNSYLHAFPHQTKGCITMSAAFSGDDKVTFIFEDDGIGIPDSYKSRIFDPFFTTKFGQGGSGLGLYLVYSLVTGTLGGQIHLEDSAKGGARFVITIPITAPSEHQDSFDIHRH